MWINRDVPPTCVGFGLNKSLKMGVIAPKIEVKSVFLARNAGKNGLFW